MHLTMWVIPTLILYRRDVKHEYTKMNKISEFKYEDINVSIFGSID